MPDVKMIKPPSWFDCRIAAYQVLALLMILALSFQLYVVNYTHVDDDELEHLHSSWLVYMGGTPYRDFFEHHNPLLWYLLSPLFMIFRDDLGIITAARSIMFILNLMILFVSYKIAREYFNRIISSLVVVAILFEYDYVISVVVIRPEIAATLLWLIAFYLFLRSMKDAEGYLFLSGLFIGVAFAFKQTAIFFLLALVASIIVQNAYKRKKKILLLVCGFTVPVILLFTYFYFNDALTDFIYLAFMFNLEHNTGNMPHRLVKVVSGFLNDIPFWTLGLAGVFTATLSLLRKRLPVSEVPLVVSTYVVLLSMVPSNVMCYYRYMPVIPLVGIYAVSVIKTIIIDGGLKYLRGSRENKLIIFSFILLVLFGLMHPLSFIVSGKIEHEGLSILLEDRTRQGNIMEFVWNITSPDDRVFDGYGIYISRNHSYRYWFLHPALFNFNLSSLDDIPEYLSETRPKVVIRDWRTGQLSNETWGFIRRHYIPSGRYGVYVVGATLGGGDLQNGSGSFYLLSPGYYDVSYDILPAGAHVIYIDNEPAGDTVYLTRGSHRIHIEDSNVCIYNITIRHRYGTR